MARKQMSREDRKKHTSPFRTSNWAWRNAEMIGKLKLAREAMRRKDLPTVGFWRVFRVKLGRFAWNVGQAPARAVCALIGHKTTMSLQGFRDQFWCFRCQKIVAL